MSFINMTEELPQKSLLLFGAGKIGRSFIAQIFSLSGYKITFVEANLELVRLLNQRRTYPVEVKSDSEKTILIQNFRALHVDEKDKIFAEVAQCNLCAVSVGTGGFDSVAMLLSGGISRRYNFSPHAPLDIILAENLRNAGRVFEERIVKQIGDLIPVKTFCGFIETSIGKMVPLMKEEDIKEDPLKVFAEPYNTLIVDAEAFKNPVPVVEGLEPRKNMKAWVDRKLFIHNLGHVSLAYLSWLTDPNWKFTWECLENRKIKNEVRATMLESARILQAMHPGIFEIKDLTDHIDDLLHRFANKALGDTVYRVGCDLPRKLGPDDRLVPVVKFGFRNALPYHRVLKVLCASVFFDGRDENGNRHPADEKFLHKFNRNIKDILIQHCSFDFSEYFTLVEEAIQLTNTLISHE